MILVLFIVVFLVLLIVYGSRNHNYWKERGVIHEKPVPLFGNAFKLIFQYNSMGQLFDDVYRKFSKEKIIGYYFGNSPALIVRDPEIIKHVFITDFHNFFRRAVITTSKNIEDVEPLSRHLFLLDGDPWKLLRQRMTPAFTSGKLKAMFPIIVRNAEKLCKIGEDAAVNGTEIDMRDLMARYTTDFIGAVGFGIEGDSLDNENSQFRKLGRRIFSRTFFERVISVLKTMAPNVFKNFKLFPDEVTNGIITLMNSVMKQRDFKPSGTNDFIDLLMEMKEKGVISGESMEKKNLGGISEIVKLELDDSLMAAQAFIFFAAGFETSSSSTSFTLHLLAYHPGEQRKCQEEIDEVLSRHGGKLSYEAVKEMKYLEMCFKESLRIYPIVSVLRRNSEAKYRIPGTDVTIDRDVIMFIPVLSLHHDENYFPEPEKFKPERFHPDNFNSVMNTVYLPFGNGPRACIGERLGIMQSTAGLAALLREFSVLPSKNSVRHPTLLPNTVMTPKNGIPLQLVARKNL